MNPWKVLFRFWNKKLKSIKKRKILTCHSRRNGWKAKNGQEKFRISIYISYVCKRELRMMKKLRCLTGRKFCRWRLTRCSAKLLLSMIEPICTCKLGFWRNIQYQMKSIVQLLRFQRINQLFCYQRRQAKDFQLQDRSWYLHDQCRVSCTVNLFQWINHLLNNECEQNLSSWKLKRKI